MKRFLTTFSIMVAMLILSTTSRAVSLTDFTYNSSGGFYEIRSANDMVKLSTFVQDDSNGAKGITFKVTVSELDFSGINFLPIGYMDQYVLVNDAFQGTFDGQGVVIKNLNINRSDKDYIGLFGYVMDGSIQNVILDASCSITGKGYVGGIAGMIREGSIHSCINKGTVKGNSRDVGGIVGMNIGKCLVTQCENMGNVTGSALVGGIIGSTQKNGVITQCKNTGNVTGEGDVGGITGQNMGDVNNNVVSGCRISYIESNISHGGFAGAIAAFSSGPLSKNYYTDDVEVVVGDNVYKDPTPRGYSGGSSLPYDVYIKEFEGVTYYHCAVPISYQGEEIPTTNELIYNENGYYEIRTADDMKTFCNRVNSGDRCQGLTFKVLVPELDMSGITMSPIGETASAYFAGTIDGNGVIIKNMTISSTTDYAGLFGFSLGGTFQGITLDASCSITGSGTVGGIVATLNAGTIKDCHNYATIQVKDATDTWIFAGGIVGNIFSDAVLSDCSNHGHVSGLNNVGGIAGINYVTLSGCTNYGTVEGTTGVGGIVGSNQSNGHIKDCINEGLVSCSERSVGGIAGYSYGQISDCITNTSSEVVGHSIVGGIAGSESDGRIEGCFNNGIVKGDDIQGGIIGVLISGTVNNCTNNGSIENSKSAEESATSGGIIGSISSNNSNVTDCHNTGNVKSKGAYVGGIAGSNSGSVNKCTNSGSIEGFSDIGGIVGSNGSNVSGCTNTGNVKGSFSEVGGIVGASYESTSVIANNKVKSGTISGNAAVGAIGGGMINGTFSDNYYYPEAQVIVQGKTYEGTTPRGVGKIVINGENSVTVYPELYDITENNGAVLNSNPDAEEDVTLTAKSYTREYGEANPKFEYEVTEGAITDGVPNITCEATATSPVGTYDIIISKGTVSNNGTVDLVNGTLTITKAPLTITCGNYTIEQGEALPEFTLEYSGWKNDETADVLTTKPTVTCEATKDSEPGTYDIIVSGAEAQNYEISYVAGTLTVTAKSLPEIEPIEAEMELKTEELSGQDLSDNVVNDVYYNIGENGYDATDQSIVISQTTNMAQIADKEPGSADVKENFSGMILKVGKGKGLITVNVKTTGNAQLVVQVGNGTPMIASKTEQGDVVVGYDVAEDTYVYIYAIIGSSAARATRAASADTVRIYGITVTPGVTGITAIEHSPSATDRYYTLDGRRMEGIPTKKGLYIVNGRKVITK